MINIEKIEDYNFEGQRLLFDDSKRFDFDRFTIMFINQFNDDYLNLAINIKAKTIEEFEEDYKEIKDIMNQNNRKASIFIHDQFLLNNVDFNSLDLQKSDENVWLILDNYNGLKNEKSNIKIKIEKVISENELKEYPSIVNEDFKRSNESDPYDGLTNSVIDAIKRSCYINGKFITEHYAAKYNNQIVGTITIMYEKNIAFIYNVTTNVKFRRKSICSQLMNHVVQRLNDIGIEEIILQTAPGYYPEKIYKNMGFKELFYGVKYIEE